MRPDELGTYLNTIRNVIANDLKPELTSAHRVAAANSSVLLLDRLVTMLKQWEQTASPRVAEWAALLEQVPGLGLGADSSAATATTGGGALDAVEARVSEIQRALQSGRTFEAFTRKLATNDAQVKAWYSRAVGALRELAEAGEPVVPTPQARGDAAPPPDETEFLRTRLTAYLEKTFPKLPKNPVARLAIAPGGHVKQTVLFRLVENELLPTRLVLRRDLPNSITGTSVVDEFPLIERAHGLGLPVPKPVFLEKDPEPLAGTFMVMTEVVDAEGAGTYFPEERKLARRTVGPDFGKEVAQVLAKLHTGTVKRGAKAPDFSDKVIEHREGWAKLAPNPFSLGMELSYAWLLSHPLPSNRPVCLVHGDVGSHNILVRSGKLAALLDWELAADGDPAVDLAQCRMMLLPDTMPWKDFQREYIAAGGDPVAADDNAVAYYCVWTYLKHGYMNAMLRGFYLGGQRDDIIAGSVAGHYYFRLMQYQARALQIAVDADRGA